jgi:hypothetical protein
MIHRNYFLRYRTVCQVILNVATIATAVLLGHLILWARP